MNFPHSKGKPLKFAEVEFWTSRLEQAATSWFSRQGG
jgi:hypothetical protein